MPAPALRWAGAGARVAEVGGGAAREEPFTVLLHPGRAAHALGHGVQGRAARTCWPHDPGARRGRPDGRSWSVTRSSRGRGRPRSRWPFLGIGWLLLPRGLTGLSDGRCAMGRARDSPKGSEIERHRRPRAGPDAVQRCSWRGALRWHHGIPVGDTALLDLERAQVAVLARAPPSRCSRARCPQGHCRSGASRMPSSSWASRRVVVLLGAHRRPSRIRNSAAVLRRVFGVEDSTIQAWVKPG